VLECAGAFASLKHFELEEMLLMIVLTPHIRLKLLLMIVMTPHAVLKIWTQACRSGVRWIHAFTMKEPRSDREWVGLARESKREESLTLQHHLMKQYNV
jgi:hypothetical protein